MTNANGALVVAERLHLLRHRRGLTVQEMADRCGLPKRSLENYMHIVSPQRPGLDALIAISDGLDVSIDWLVGKATDSISPRMTRKDYSMACFAAVSKMLRELAEEQASSSDPIIRGEQIGAKTATEVAVFAMLDFVDRIDPFDDTAETHQSGRAELFDSLRTAARGRKQ